MALIARAPALAGGTAPTSSSSPRDAAAAGGWIEPRLTELDLARHVPEGTDLTAFVGDAQVLTDDHAPVDQLLTPYG